MPDDDDRELFDLRAALPALDGGGWRDRVRRALDEALGLPQVRRHFHAATLAEGEPFAAALAAFGVELTVTGANAIPVRGPVVVMANHPFGGADALALAALCHARRPDTLLMANEMAAALPVLGASMVPLSILGGEDSARKNASSLKRSLQHLRGGGLLAVFPSGEVASWRGAGVEESPWSRHIAALAARTAATVVLARFSGRAPAWFHLLGILHPLVRTALLPRVLLSQAGRRVEVEILPPLSAVEFNGLRDPAADLRRRVMGL